MKRGDHLPDYTICMNCKQIIQKGFSMSEYNHEHPNTYFVQDRSNGDELERLRIQERLLTRSLGGILPEQPLEKLPFQCVLDVGCGPAGWLIEIAKTYPESKRLVGVDVSSSMAHYARNQVEAEHVEDHVEILVMDALRMLEFPDRSFDLINQRLGSSYLRIWDWQRVLSEYQRIARPRGIIRITECSVVESNSAALTELASLLRTALYLAGHLFTPSNEALTTHLETLLTRTGIRNVQQQFQPLHFHGGTPDGTLFTDDIIRGFHNLRPFLQKWTRLPENYDDIYQQAMKDMQEPDFEGIWTFSTAWGVAR